MKPMFQGHDGHAITWIDGEWVEGNPPILGPMTHATWMASVAFDGARAFRRLAPDLDRHVARSIDSALAMGLQPTVTADEIEDLAWQGVERFPPDAELYIRPLFYAEEGFVVAVPESTRFILSVFEAPLPAGDGMTTCLSRFRRPAPDMAPTDAKASCLYPNVARALREARANGFDSAVILDHQDYVAEFATANLFMVKDGIVHTPVPNGTFLNGITRQRIIGLLRDNDIEVCERTITVPELVDADEIFSTGNHAKVQPITRYEGNDMQAGPIAKQARELYWKFARENGQLKR